MLRGHAEQTSSRAGMGCPAPEVPLCDNGRTYLWNMPESESQQPHRAASLCPPWGLQTLRALPQVYSCNESALRLLTTICRGTSRSQTKERAGGAGLPAHHSMATSASAGVMPRPSHTSPTAVLPGPQATCHAPSASLLLAQQARLTLLWNAWRVRWAQFRPQCKNQCRTPKLGRSRETPTNQKQA